MMGHMTMDYRFLANVSSRLLYAVARPSVISLSVCRLSVTLVHPTQAVEILFLWHLVPWPSFDIHKKFYRDRPRGTPQSGELNTRVRRNEFLSYCYYSDYYFIFNCSIDSLCVFMNSFHLCSLCNV